MRRTRDERAHHVTPAHTPGEHDAASSFGDAPRPPSAPDEPRGGADDPLRRCERCGFQMRSCLCPELRPLDVATRVVVLRHRREVFKTSNTGRLVPLMLRGGEVRRVGGPGVKIDPLSIVDPDRRVVLLYPSRGSAPLASDPDDPRPLTLLVPDTTWTLAGKLARREPALLDLPHVHLPQGEPSRYRLRHHPDPRFLATFEAVARALGIVEGPAVRAELERVFGLFVERTLASRFA